MGQENIAPLRSRYRLTIYRLGDQGYTSVERSVELPALTSQLLTNFLKDAEETDDDNQLLQDYVEAVLQVSPTMGQ